MLAAGGASCAAGALRSGPDARRALAGSRLCKVKKSLEADGEGPSLSIFNFFIDTLAATA